MVSELWVIRLSKMLSDSGYELRKDPYPSLSGYPDFAVYAVKEVKLYSFVIAVYLSQNSERLYMESSVNIKDKEGYTSLFCIWSSAPTEEELFQFIKTHFFPVIDEFVEKNIVIIADAAVKNPVGWFDNYGFTYYENILQLANMNERNKEWEENYKRIKYEHDKNDVAAKQYREEWRKRIYENCNHKFVESADMSFYRQLVVDMNKELKNSDYRPGSISWSDKYDRLINLHLNDTDWFIEFYMSFLEHAFR